MQIVRGIVEIDAIETFLENLQAIGDQHDALVQAVDARYVAGPRHLERAVASTRRAQERGTMIADDLSLELLLAIAATRQIDRGMEIGVRTGRNRIVVVVDGGETSPATDAVGRLLESTTAEGTPDTDRLMEWFEISEEERRATSASLEELVVERVALLELER